MGAGFSQWGCYSPLWLPGIQVQWLEPSSYLNYEANLEMKATSRGWQGREEKSTSLMTKGCSWIYLHL